MTSDGDRNANKPMDTGANLSRAQENLPPADMAVPTDTLTEMKNMLAVVLKKSEEQDKLNRNMTNELKALATESRA